MQNRLLIVLMLIMLTLSATAAQTQENAQDLLIIESEGDYWSWSEDTGLFQLTYWGYNWGLDRSLGRYLAYASTADFVVEAFQRKDYYPIEIIPTNIWLYDLQTGEAVRIASQPSNAVYNAEQVSGYNRFDPHWSPDGTKLAWVQFVAGGDNYTWQLVVYDVASGTEQVAVDRLPGPFGDAGFIGYIRLRWETVGLITDTFGGTDDNFFGQTFRIYDENGTLLTEHHFGTSQDGLRDWFWNEDDPLTGIVGIWTNYQTQISTYFQVDPFAGTEQELPDVVPVSLARNAQQGLALYFEKNGESQIASWWSSKQGDASLPYILTGRGALPSQIAIAPDGERIAYLTDALYIWEDDQAQPIPDTEQFVTADSAGTLTWGEPLWQLRPRSELPSTVG